MELRMQQARLLSYQCRLVIRMDTRQRSSLGDVGVASNLLQASDIRGKPIYDASYATNVITTVCADATVNVFGRNSYHADSKRLMLKQRPGSQRNLRLVWPKKMSPNTSSWC